MECMICQYDDEEEDADQEIHVVERPGGAVTICEVCDTRPFICRECDYRWMYGGNAERPTCPRCKSKAVEPVEQS